MKRVLICIATLLCAIGCASRKEIDDKTLAIIFRDAYITNAYLGINYTNTDSLKIYEPILERYGYTAEDLRYTIGNFSRRKSAQLGRVLKDAEEQIAKIASVYEHKVVVLDTIKNVAVRTFKRTVRKDSLITIKKLSDTTKLRMVIEPLQPGTYAIRYKYTYKKPEVKRKRSKSGRLDTYALRGAMHIETHNGSRRNNYSYNLREEEYIRRTLSADTAAQRLVLTFAKTADPTDKFRKSDITISDLEILYTPDEGMAIDSLYKRFVDIKIFDDAFYTTAQDSLALSADTTRVL